MQDLEAAGPCRQEWAGSGALRIQTDSRSFGKVEGLWRDAFDKSLACMTTWKALATINVMAGT